MSKLYGAGSFKKLPNGPKILQPGDQQDVKNLDTSIRSLIKEENDFDKSIDSRLSNFHTRVERLSSTASYINPNTGKISLINSKESLPDEWKTYNQQK